MADYNEIEQRILDMWPKFKDGCYVQLGDKVVANSGENKGREFIVRNVYFENGHGKLRSSVSDGCYWNWKSADTRVKRPAPKVLDADGVEIHVGETLYGIGREQHKYEVINPHYIVAEAGEVFTVLCYDRDDGEECHCRPEMLTHTQPDSWERLERDAEKSICDYFGSSSSPGSLCEDGCPGLNSPVSCGVLMKLDLIRRAKALAEKEAGR